MIFLSTFIYWVLIIMHGLPFRPLGQPQTGFLIFLRSTGQRSHRPHLSRFCCSLVHNTYMVLCTNFHDHGMQYREINLYFQICINITGVLKLLDGTVFSRFFCYGATILHSDSWVKNSSLITSISSYYFCLYI